MGGYAALNDMKREDPVKPSGPTKPRRARHISLLHLKDQQAKAAGLEPPSPSALWARTQSVSHAGFGAQQALSPSYTALLLALIVLVNANDQVLKELSKSSPSQTDFPYQVSSVVLLASLISVLGGISIVSMVHGPIAAVRQCLDPRQLRPCCLPSILFTYANVLRFSALRFIPADALAAMEPIFGLAFSALGAWAIKGRAFKRCQVVALLVALVALCAFFTLGGSDYDRQEATFSPKGASDGSRLKRKHIGLGWLCALGSAVLGTCAGLTSEWFLKEGDSSKRQGSQDPCGTTFIVQKVQLEVPALFAALVSSVLLEPWLDSSFSVSQPASFGLTDGSLLRGWDTWTLVVLLAMVARSWLASSVVKHLDTLCYSLAQVFAMLLTFIELEIMALARVSGIQETQVLQAQRLGVYAAMAVVFLSIGAFSWFDSAINKKIGARKVSMVAELGEPLLPRHNAGPRRKKRWTCPAFSYIASVLSWFRQHSMSLLLMAGYVSADTGKMLLVCWANNYRKAESFLPSSLLLVQLLISAAIAFGMAVMQVGAPGLTAAVHPLNIARCMPVAAFFFLSKACTVSALGHVDAGTVKLSTQLILPCTALLSTILIAGRRYSREQWVSIITICFGTLAFHGVQIEAEAANAGSKQQAADRWEARLVGLVLCGIVVLANSVGSVVGERFLHAFKDTPLACLKAQLVLAELVVVVAVLSGWEAPQRGGGWFVGWDWRVLICAIGWVPATWMSTLITARFSTVVKNLVQCFSTVTTYFLSLIHSERDHYPCETLLALVVMMSVWTFSLQSVGTKDSQKGSESEGTPSDSEAPKQQQRHIQPRPSISWSRRRFENGRRSLPRADSSLELACCQMDGGSSPDVNRRIFFQDWVRSVTD